jgi:hypothetical protein
MWINPPWPRRRTLKHGTAGRPLPETKSEFGGQPVVCLRGNSNK